MPLSRIITADGSITESKLAANAVTQPKLAANAAQFPQIADGNVITSKLDANLTLSGKTVFGAAVQERSNIIASNIGPTVIDIDPLFNSILFYTANSHDNTSHTVNFINLDSVDVGNTVSFVVALTNNVDSFANITTVQVNGSTCVSEQARTATSNNLFVSGGHPVTIGSANVDLYSFNIQKVQTSSYTVFLSKTNFS